MKGNLEDCLTEMATWNLEDEGRYMASAAQKCADLQLEITLLMTGDEPREQFEAKYLRLRNDFLELKDFVNNARESSAPTKKWNKKAE